MDALVVMGVAGCGKSSVARAVSEALNVAFIEGDDFHSRVNRDKMRRGIALTDDDRADWLDALARALEGRSGPAIVACSALKRAYRDRLRQARPRLRFAFLDIDPRTVAERMAARQGHFFSPALVKSQFDTLEPPLAEPAVLHLDARRPLPELVQTLTGWMREPPAPA